MCLYNEHRRPPELAGTQATLQMLAYNLPFREAALTNCNSLFGCAQLTFPSVNTAHSQINPTLQQDKQQQWVQIHLLTGQCKHSEFLSWCQVILQEKAFVSRKSSPLTYKALRREILSAAGLSSISFLVLTLITRSFFETTRLFKTSCPRAQGQVCRCGPVPFPPSLGNPEFLPPNLNQPSVAFSWERNGQIHHFRSFLFCSQLFLPLWHLPVNSFFGI